RPRRRHGAHRRTGAPRDIGPGTRPDPAAGFARGRWPCARQPARRCGPHRSRTRRFLRTRARHLSGTRAGRACALPGDRCILARRRCACRVGRRNRGIAREVNAMSDEEPVVVVIAPGDPLPAWCRSQWNVLAARAANGTLPHALLLCGPADLGKRALTEAFVRVRLCGSPREGNACGTCRACKLLAAGTHPDRMRVKLEPNPKTGVMRKEIVVDQIRDLSSRLAMASQLGGWQIAVIDT